MTAHRKPTPNLHPRLFVRTPWVLHHALLRVSGRRIGLSRPESRKRFGLMRLNTLGRRSGRPRVAIVGYYDYGPSFVTLAMNGWADPEPAWWLNLQACADTTVDWADGSRAVRARAAAGPERERLWARLREYPGWGNPHTTSAHSSQKVG